MLVEYETRWAEIAAANLALAHSHGATGPGWSCAAMPPHWPSWSRPRCVGPVVLVLTSPPYVPTVHGLVRPNPHRGGQIHPRTPKFRIGAQCHVSVFMCL
jgi:hypothetical protein